MSNQADHEKNQLTTNLKESQEGLEKTRGELDAHHARVSRLLGHVSALVTLHDQDDPSKVQTGKLLESEIEVVVLLSYPVALGLLHTITFAAQSMKILLSFQI